MLFLWELMDQTVLISTPLTHEAILNHTTKVLNFRRTIVKIDRGSETELKRQFPLFRLLLLLLILIAFLNCSCLYLNTPGLLMTH